jgi:hypothetical protein
MPDTVSLDEARSKYLVDIPLPEGGKVQYPAYFIPTLGEEMGAEPIPIPMLPLSAGVEAAAFALIGQLMDELPELDEIFGKIGEAGGQVRIGNWRSVVKPSQVVGLVRKGTLRAPQILIKLGAVLTGLTEDQIGKLATQTDLARLLVPVVNLERYRVGGAFTRIMEEAGLDMADLEEDEPSALEVIDGEVSD